MGDVDSEGEGLRLGARVRDTITFLVWFTGRIGLRLELGSGINVRMRPGLWFNVILRCG